MNRGLKIYITVTTTLCLILTVACGVLLVRTRNSTLVPAASPWHEELSSRLQQAEAAAADCLEKASSLESSFTQEPPVVSTAKVVAVYEDGENLYCYFPREEIGRPAIAALPEELTVDVKVGDQPFVAYEGLNQVGCPCTFSRGFRADVLGEASEDEFSQAMDFFEAEIKPYL